MKEKNKYVLRFSLGEDEYAFRIEEVKEVIRMVIIKEIPRLPGFVKGAVNYRGQIIMVIDLRERFGLEDYKFTKNTRIIIVNINTKDIAFIVDSVNKIEDVSSNNITSPANYPVTIDENFIYGIFKSDENIIPVLNVPGILSKEEIETLSNVKLDEKLMYDEASKK
ncbi:chemotaxis protein CheW [candidate division KSB1 bacterium]